MLMVDDGREGDGGNVSPLQALSSLDGAVDTAGLRPLSGAAEVVGVTAPHLTGRGTDTAG